MRRLTILVFFILLACSKDSPIPDAVVPTPTVTFTLAVTASEGGTVSNPGDTHNENSNVSVTATPANEFTFLGWTGDASRLGENPNCEFNFIEFNDDTYLMAIDSDGRTEYLGGVYVVNENSDNKVTSVELKFTLDSKEITIATLTDIVVVETNSKLDATFEILLNFPEDADFAPCNSLSGSVSVDKEEPLEASKLKQEIDEVKDFPLFVY